MSPTYPKTSAYIIWFIGVSFVLFQFFLQLSSGVIINKIMTEMHLSALHGGLLSGAFYVVYTGMQIPVGIWFERFNNRVLLTSSALICSLGCFLFAHSYSYIGLIGSRIIIGFGSSFAFVGLCQLLRRYFPLRQFSFLIGLSETFGFILCVVGMFTLGEFVTHFGWRLFFQGAMWAGLIITTATWLIIPNTRPDLQHANLLSTHAQLSKIIRNKLAWVNGLFVACGFMVITIFAAMWAVPFLQLKLHCDLNQASQLDAMLYLGVAISCPLLGQLHAALPQRKLLLILTSAITGILLGFLIYVPITSLVLCGALLFAIGLFSGNYMLAYSISNEITDPSAKSTATGFTNTIATLTPLLQPLIGKIIDSLDASAPFAKLLHYQYALSILPIALFIAAFLVLFLPEKTYIRA